jgi:hypothetical protein
VEHWCPHRRDCLLEQDDLDDGWADQVLVTGKGERERVIFFDQRTLSARLVDPDVRRVPKVRLSAWLVQPMGQVGRKSGAWDGGQPRRREPVGATAVSQGRQPAPVAQDDDFETLPF